MRTLFYLLLLSLGGVACQVGKQPNPEKTAAPFKINWVDALAGDFTFAQRWSYPEGIYYNRFGQLSCDGLCPEEAELLKDAEGRIPATDLANFYAVVDTTHLFHSLSSASNAPEFFGSDFIEATIYQNGTCKVHTLTNVGTHSSLHLKLTPPTFQAWIDFNSVTLLGRHQFPLKTGTLTLDQTAWAQGILKAQFDLTFDNTLEEDPQTPFHWKGKMLKKLN